MYSCERIQPRRSSRRNAIFEGKPHPLLIPSIINEVSTYLSLKELKTFRLVCKEWREEAHKIIKKIGKIVFPNLQVLLEFINEMKNSPRYYHNFEFRSDMCLGNELLNEFYSRFGDKVYCIYINRIRWTESELKEVLFDKLPNLTEIGLEARAYSDRRLFVSPGEEKGLPKIRTLNLNIFSFITELTTPFLRDILRLSPNVEEIRSLRTEKRNPLPMQFIEYVCHEMNYDICDDIVQMPFMSDISLAEVLIETNDLKLDKLHNLNCNLRLRAQGIAALIRRKFQLNHLDVTLLSDVSPEILHTLLHSMESCLRKLKLKYHPQCNSSMASPVPPNFVNLISLDLNGYKGSLKFIESVPNLQTLILHRVDFNHCVGMETVQIKNESRLTTLEVHENFSPNCPVETIHVIALLFPNLTRLKLENVSDDGLRVIFQELPSLIEIDLNNGSYTDAGITGFGPGACKTLRVSDSYYYDIDEEKRVFPNISALRDLRSLSLASPNITDVSILYGVLSCKGLRRISLKAYGITDVSLRSLIDDLDLFYVETQYCNRLTQRVKKYATEKMHGREIHINEYKGNLKQSEIPKLMRRFGQVMVKVDKLD